MKNIHLLQTNKPSRLYLHSNGEFQLRKELVRTDEYLGFNQHAYITSDEEIKKGDYRYSLNRRNVELVSEFSFKVNKEYWELNKEYYKKVILTTDQDLINDGVQDIDDDFLQWFVKNPSCEKVEVKKWSSLAECGYSYHIVIPKEEQKQHLIDIIKGDEELRLYESTHTFQVLEYWQPTPILRWKRISIDKLNYNKVLQQMWHGSLGKQEWRDVQEED